MQHFLRLFWSSQNPKSVIFELAPGPRSALGAPAMFKFFDKKHFFKTRCFGSSLNLDTCCLLDQLLNALSIMQLQVLESCDGHREIAGRFFSKTKGLNRKFVFCLQQPQTMHKQQYFIRRPGPT